MQTIRGTNMQTIKGTKQTNLYPLMFICLTVFITFLLTSCGSTSTTKPGNPTDQQKRAAQEAAKQQATATQSLDDQEKRLSLMQKKLEQDALAQQKEAEESRATMTAEMSKLTELMEQLASKDEATGVTSDQAEMITNSDGTITLGLKDYLASLGAPTNASNSGSKENGFMPFAYSNNSRPGYTRTPLMSSQEPTPFPRMFPPTGSPTVINAGMSSAAWVSQSWLPRVQADYTRISPLCDPSNSTGYSNCPVQDYPFFVSVGDELGPQMLERYYQAERELLVCSNGRFNQSYFDNYLAGFIRGQGQDNWLSDIQIVININVYFRGQKMAEHIYDQYSYAPIVIHRLMQSFRREYEKYITGGNCFTPPVPQPCVTSFMAGNYRNNRCGYVPPRIPRCVTANRVYQPIRCRATRCRQYITSNSPFGRGHGRRHGRGHGRRHGRGRGQFQMSISGQTTQIASNPYTGSVNITDLGWAVIFPDGQI